MKSSSSLRSLRFGAVSLVAAALVVAAPASGQSSQGGPLFPRPFVTEHHLVQTDGDGSRFATQPVTDYYGGSWIVSVRPDGGRLVVDLARREITGIQPKSGTYWSVTFDHLADLAARLARAEKLGTPRPAGAAPGARAAKSAATTGGGAGAGAAAAPAELIVQDLPTPFRRSADAGSAVASRPGVEHLRVVERSRADDAGAGVEVWLDPSVRLGPAAQDALAAFESALAGPKPAAGGSAAATGPERPPVGRYLALARSHAAGAMPVRTLRTVGDGPPTARARLEDVTTRLEPLDDFPEDLVKIPEGLRRVPHPLEAAVAFLETAAKQDRAMAGSGAGAGDGN